ncbi:membrane protein [Arthrobacter phage Wollypog]|uniref:Membrane protein n=1 Tax=Arthrobacter phage Wollypog TaxID=2790985 RepID=A0A7T3KCC7_9CAUD|nr:minor tail protein [Arthrobacter phage Wollypog]QPX62574.1 membrane protein [Arthrobacter phage Wollypog]
MAKFKVNGARGVVFIAFAAVAFVFGLAFFSPIALIPPPPAGLVALDKWIPLQWWGGGWYIASITLIWGAFREDQHRAQIPFAALLGIWMISYFLESFNTHIPRLQTAFLLQSVVFAAILVASMGVARLVNAPPVDVEALRRKLGLKTEDKEE